MASKECVKPTAAPTSGTESGLSDTDTGGISECLGTAWNVFFRCHPHVSIIQTYWELIGSKIVGLTNFTSYEHILRSNFDAGI